MVVHIPYNACLFTNLKQPRKAGSIVFAGRLVTDKGVDILLKALSLLDPASYDSLLIVGDGPERRGLEALVITLNLKAKARFLGKMDAEQLADLLNRSDIMVVPSIVEPFGITVLEGLACGCR